MITRSIDHLRFYVKDAREAARLYCSALGFRVVAEAGPETGMSSQRAYLLQQGSMKVVLAMALTPTDEAAEYVSRHGDGVKDIAFQTPDAVKAFEEAVRRGARPVREPVVHEGGGARVISATVAAPMGDLVHTFVQREGRESVFMPGLFQETFLFAPPPVSAIDSLDHVAICVAPGTLDSMVRFYEEVFNFHLLHSENVRAEYSGMNSKVVANAHSRITFPMMEPAPGSRRRGQIEEFLELHGGPGVQHMALLSQDIAETIRALSGRQLEFLNIPAAYYEALPERLGETELDLRKLREHGILADRDTNGILLQAFTRSMHPRRTLFFEVIQRLNSRGFGGGNIRALFEAKEREQARGLRATA
ncbi:4-hydroxyphenylpyruvate dioxygenase [Hyalangium sp.]|uniref:4-hydroxyphenylpyruvate dioxygenase n=1 Tax=Hyalangium sp. TaxID=2028555 RepID=UPI002D7015A5|nr:4-hydroxyphenylpyruvate dioxygenase [Hyalangium sp.]HYH99434.1 4-hydroxyphenylpyruvate dioxygenase [Hyalangium sp.]